MQVQETDIPIKPGEIITSPDGQLCYDYHQSDNKTTVRLLIDIEGIQHKTAICYLFISKTDMYFYFLAIADRPDKDFKYMICKANGEITSCGYGNLDNFDSKRRDKEALASLGFPPLSYFPEQTSFNALVEAFLKQIRQHIFEVPPIEAATFEP